MNLEKLQSMPVDQLQARLDKIIPTIKLLTDVWNNPTMNAHIIAAWQLPHDAPADEQRTKHVVFDIDHTDASFDDLLLFIHNYCTNLCAEKHLLMSLLSQQKA